MLHVMNNVLCKGMTCMYDAWEEYDERSEGAGTVSMHELRGIEKGKEQECRRYGQREM